MATDVHHILLSYDQTLINTGRGEGTVVAFSHDKKPVCIVQTASLPSEDTSSDQALHTLKEWIGNCVENHRDCGRSLPNKCPKRILEIGDTCVYLREHLEILAKYACLSHCWGKTGPSLRLDKVFYRALTTGVPIGQLPKIFRDAVALCVRLSLKYIWIDAVCKL